jgi:hypothetical protein
MCLKLNILNALNIIVLSSDLKNKSSLCNPFFQNLKTLKFLYVLNFHQVHPMNMYFHIFKNINKIIVHKIWN